MNISNMHYFRRGSFLTIFRLILIFGAISIYVLYVKGRHILNRYKIITGSESMPSGSINSMLGGVNMPKVKYLVDTETCKIIDANPFDESIKHLLSHNTGRRYCVGPTLTYIKDSTIYIVKMTGTRDVAYCRVKPILKQGYRWFQFGKQSKIFYSSLRIGDEFLKIECLNSSGSVISESFHMNFVHKIPNNVSSSKIRKHYSNNKRSQLQDAKLKMPERPSGQLNVLLIMLDSTSRINSLRYMPQTRKFLSETLGAVEMLGYNKVGDNTMPNMVPFLTGEFADKQPCLNDKQGVDNCSFIWKKFSKKGYVTHFGEDWYWSGTFRGFKYPPTDYYDHPFHAANEQSKKSMFNTCFHGKLSSQILHDRMFQLASNIKEFSYFSLSTHSRHTHNFLTGLAEIDNITKNTLSKLHNNNLLNNTLLAVFGDHGMRFGDVRQTFIGQLEERLPFMFIYVPVWFRTKYKTYFRNLNINRRRLTTHFDMHSTLLHLLKLDSKATENIPWKGISLFNEIPYNRSCEDAGILPHWCTCNYHLISKDNTTITKILASTLVNHINELLKKFSDICEKLEVMKINHSFKLLSRDRNTDEHRIVIITKPGDIIFESTLIYNETSKSFLVNGDISRLNMYKGQSYCIKDYILKKMCICKKHLSQGSQGNER